MKKNIIIVGIFVMYSYQSIMCVGERSSNSDSNNNPSVNFYGVVETHQGNKFKVEDINFNKLYKKVPVYEMPAQESFELDSSDRNARILKKNPSESLAITEFSLAGTKAISVPYPDVVWCYDKKSQITTACPIECGGNNRRYKICENSNALKYIQIQVTDREGKRTDYLVESNKTIYCKEVNASSSEEKIHPIRLPAIKTLTIMGYCKHTEEKEKLEPSECKRITANTSSDKKSNTRHDEVLRTSSRNKRLRSTKIVRVSQNA